jgi:hypothetical protein
MKNMHSKTSAKILKRFHKEREIPLSSLAAMLPKYHKDHKDFYPLAYLIKNDTQLKLP